MGARPRQAVILAGGLGTRLGALTRDVPKPLIEVAGRPFLEHLIWNLARYGIDDLVLATSYLSERIEAVIGDGSRLGVKVRYAREAEPLGTGGALRNALPMLDEAFFALNGDTLFDVNYLALSSAMAGTDAAGAVALRAVEDAGRYGKVRLSDGRIAELAEKAAAGPGLINGGVYALTREVAEAIAPDRAVSLEREVLPALIAKGRVLGLPAEGYFIDIGLPETLGQAQVDLADWRRRPIAFLDRDGVLNLDHGYVHKPGDCDWTPGAMAAVRFLNEAGYLVVVVTNQAGIGRGYYSETDFAAFMDWFRDELAMRGAHLDDVLHSPYHPTEGQGAYRLETDCRKPGPGMLLRAMERWEHDRARSFLVGDKPSDLEAARRAGVRGFLYEGGDLEAFVRAANDVMKELGD